MSNHTTDPMLSMEDRARDPMLKTMLSAGDLFGGMLTASTPMPTLQQHPTRGICRSCKAPILNAWIAFCGDWTPHRECDACAAKSKAKLGPQPIKQYPQRNDRTEPKAA